MPIHKHADAYTRRDEEVQESNAPFAKQGADRWQPTLAPSRKEKRRHTSVTETLFSFFFAPRPLQCRTAECSKDACLCVRSPLYIGCTPAVHGGQCSLCSQGIRLLPYSRISLLVRGRAIEVEKRRMGWLHACSQCQRSDGPRFTPSPSLLGAQCAPFKGNRHPHTQG